MTSFFSAEGGPIWINIADWYRMRCRLRWCVEMETRCRIPIWRTFGRIQWHVIPEVLPLGEFTVTIHEPHATLQGAVSWRNQCRDRPALHGVRIPSAILKIVFRHILFFLFLMQFRLWRSAAFVSSPIHLLIVFHSRYVTKSDDIQNVERSNSLQKCDLLVPGSGGVGRPTVPTPLGYGPAPPPNEKGALLCPQYVAIHSE